MPDCLSSDSLLSLQANLKFIKTDLGRARRVFYAHFHQCRINNFNS